MYRYFNSTTLITLILFSIVCITNLFAEMRFCNEGLSRSNDGHIEKSRKKAEELYRLRSVKTTILNRISGGIEGQDVFIMKGVPSTVELVDPSTLGVVRHYSAVADKIAESKMLISGKRPYIDPTPHERYEYVDLTGIFFTTRDYPLTELWFTNDSEMPYVDFKLPAGVGVLKIRDGIYLIPGGNQHPEWLIEKYIAWKRGEAVEPYLVPTLIQMESASDVSDVMKIPIEIVDYKKNTK